MPDFVVKSTMQVYRASLVSTCLLLLLLCSVLTVRGTEIGWVSPQGPLNVLVHHPYNISCTLNPAETKYTSHDLMFYAHEDKPVKTVRTVNDSTIELHVESATPGIHQYICKVNRTMGIGMKRIAVGYKPRNVSNFKCHSQNWQNMNCSFKQAENPIQTSYNLKFEFENSPGDFQCPLIGQYDNKWECFRDMDNSYRQSQEIYKFILESTNIFGNNTERFVINHYDNVIPDAPSECIASNITSRSAFLHWSISYKLQTFKRDFVFQIKILSSFDNKNWKTVNVSRISRKLTNYTLPVDTLEYADTSYDVRIRMKTATAEDSEEMWSNYSSCLFNTLPRRPDNPPEVAIGGFEINAYNDVFVYWKEIPKSKHNSATGFQYKPDIKRNELPSIPPPIVGRNGSTMIQYRNMTDGNYTFVILSSNSEGDSLKSSKLFIPSKEYRVHKPEIIKLLSDSGRYLLSWKAAPTHNAKITSYTVFWCNSSSNSPNDCNGSINFDYVDGDKHSYELNNVSSTLNFAVAANVEELSSGMVWASCTATQKNDIGKLKTIWIPAMQSTYIDLEWKLECGDSAIVEGYSIIYCPINLPRAQSCKEPEKTVNITGSTSHRIDNLKPYVTYKIQIAMYSKTRIGPRSDPLFNTTLEAAPSEPRELVYSEVRNDSVTLHWKPPLHINGGKMNYEVWYNKSKIKVYTENYTSEQSYILRGLEPFMNYKIIVLAFTIGQSNASNSVDIKTEIGTPGVIQQPGSEDSSESKQLSIVWQPPEPKAGCIEYYELKIKTNTQNDDSMAITRIQSTKCKLKRTICRLASADSTQIDKYEFSVRAVNVILSPHAPNYTIWNKLSCDKKYSYYSDQIVSNTYQFSADADDIECELDDDEIANIDWIKIDKFATLVHGEWSKPLAHWCNYGNENAKAIVFLTMIACSGIISLIICTYLSYRKMKQIKNIKVVLPDALNDIVTSEKIEAFKDNGSFYGLDNYSEFAEKIQDDSHVPFTEGNDDKNFSRLDDTASLSSAEIHLNNGEMGTNEADLLSLPEDLKSQYSLPMDSAECAPAQPILPKQSFEVPSNLMKFSPSGYVSAPVAKPATNGYVQAPIAKPTTTNYVQPHMFMGNAGLAKTPIVTSTDEKGISGYVTHKQLSDYGHRM